jgi:hypothetical protein
MATLIDQYVGELYKKFGRFAPWLPDTPIALGAVGVVEGGEFIKKTNLESLGIAWTPSKPGPASVLDHSSATGVTIALKAKGEVVPGSILLKGDAGARISFAKLGGVVLQASDVRVVSIKDTDSVARAILDMFALGIWHEDWVFVDEVRTAASTTILISEEKSSRLELKAAGNLQGPAALAGGLVVAAKQGSITSFVGSKGCTPLFNLSRVKKQWLQSILDGKPKGKITGAKRAAAAPIPTPKIPDGEALLAPVQFKPTSRQS